jgi:hypothetical protein
MPGTYILLCPPKLVTTSIADCFAAPGTTIFYIVRHIHVANIDTVAQPVSVCLSTTGDQTAGTELLKGVSVPAASYIDLYGSWRIAPTKLLNAITTGTTNKLVITISGEAYAV